MRVPFPNLDLQQPLNPPAYTPQATVPQYQQHPQQQQQYQPQQYQAAPAPAQSSSVGYSGYGQPMTSAVQQGQQQQPITYRQPSPSSGMVTLRQSTPISQRPAPVYQSQPPVSSFNGKKWTKGRGTVKWAPEVRKDHLTCVFVLFPVGLRSDRCRWSQHAWRYEVAARGVQAASG